MSTLLAPGGHFLFTVFALTPFSRERIAKGQTKFPGLIDGVFERDGTVLIGNPADRLALICYDVALLDRMVSEAGLIPTVMEYGNWRNDGSRESLQDIVICRKPPE